MICLTCGTEILERDSYFWQFDPDEDTEGAMHDDCLIRELEFIGDLKKAKQIYEGSVKAYKIINS